MCSSSLRIECCQFTFQMSNISIAHSSEEGTIWWGERASGSWILDQGSWYNVTGVENGKGKIFLYPHSLLPKNFLFLCPTRVSILWKICVYIHISDWVGIAFKLPLLPNYTASETFLGKSVGMGSVNWVFVIEATSCCDWGNMWHWTNVSLTSCQTGLNSNTSYFQIFVLIAFNQEKFLEI